LVVSAAAALLLLQLTTHNKYKTTDKAGTGSFGAARTCLGGRTHHSVIAETFFRRDTISWQRRSAGVVYTAVSMLGLAMMGRA
jgi:hypothetical protein